MDLSLGIWQPSELELQEERDALMRSEYYDPIERFPEKIGQLLEALNQVRVNFLMMKTQTRLNSFDASYSSLSSYSTGLILNFTSKLNLSNVCHAFYV
jgi:hypothetical protein